MIDRRSLLSLSAGGLLAAGIPGRANAETAANQWFADQEAAGAKGG